MNKISRRLAFSLGLLLGIASSEPVLAAGAAESNVAKSDVVPVYLFRDELGTFYTFDPFADGNGAISRLVPRQVAAAEIRQLEDLGLEVRIVESDAFFGDTALAAEQRERVPRAFALVSMNGQTYGTFYVDGDQPEGGGTHWLTFSFGSWNLQDFHSHAAIGLLFDTEQFTSSFPPSYLPAVVGNGIVLGNLSGSIGGCGQGQNTDPIINMQVESYWHEGVPDVVGGNKLYPSTCYPWGIDQQIFRVEVEADTDGNVGYGRTAGHWNQPRNWSSPVIDTSPDRPPGRPGTLSGGGIFFAIVGNPNPDASATVMLFLDVRAGWN